MSFEAFQDGCRGGHLGYRNGMILAILNLCVTVLPHIKFLLNQLRVKEEMSFEEFQDGGPGGHFGYRNGNNFSNSESLCHYDASY